MTIKVTLEFASVDQAIVALAKLVPPVVKKEMTNPDALKTVAELTGNKTTGTPDEAKAKAQNTGSAAPAPEAPTQRKGRADKGKPRGPRKNAAAGSGTESTDVVAAPPVAIPAAAPETAAIVQVLPPQPETVTTVTSLTPQQTIEAIYEKHNVEGAMQFLSRFGVKRVRELKPEQHAEFITHGAAVLAGGAI